MNRSIFIGFDPREAAGFAVARHSARRHLTRPIPIYGLCLSEVIAAGFYTRPTRRRDNRLIDELSIRDDYDGSISTEHALVRFCIPHILTGWHGWAVFLDGDVLVRDNLVRIFDNLDSDKALYCVHHHYAPINKTKMDDQVQTRYPRKNWSSVMIFNLDHPSNRKTIPIVNKVPGRDLHRFCWLDDNEIGELDERWNWLVGHSSDAIDPAIVHFTEGLPDMHGYRDVVYADEWREQLADWVEPGGLFEGGRRLREIANG